VKFKLLKWLKRLVFFVGILNATFTVISWFFINIKPSQMIDIFLNSFFMTIGTLFQGLLFGVIGPSPILIDLQVINRGFGFLLIISWVTIFFSSVYLSNKAKTSENTLLFFFGYFLLISPVVTAVWAWLSHNNYRLLLGEEPTYHAKQFIDMGIGVSLFIVLIFIFGMYEKYKLFKNK
jgi:hypothetical protein